MTLSTKDITLLPKLNGQKGRLYYYQGNFYHPISLLAPGPVKRAICEFLAVKENRVLFNSDRASPDYKTELQLFDEQCTIN